MGEERDCCRSIPVFNGGLETTAQIKIWQEILNNERGFAREWDEKWGLCYKAPKKQPRPHKDRSTSTSRMFKNRSAPNLASLAAAGGQVVEAPPPYKSWVDPDDPRADRLKVMEARDKLPARWRYKNPVTAAHTIGWCRTRPSLELFGVAQYGVSASPDLMPEY
mmetsp:Transcript_3073/g.4125  ORF Transcript_3073/g.4125 Transcript_3073/m.4125 type:complete len:164 (+) Transcript_3073:65-556(+)